MFIDMQDVVKRRKYLKCVSKILIESRCQWGWTDVIASFRNQGPSTDCRKAKCSWCQGDVTS